MITGVIYARVSSIGDRQSTERQVKELIDCGINLYIQKEQFTLLDDEGSPSLFAPIMIASL